MSGATSLAVEVAREPGEVRFTRRWSARAPLPRVVAATRLELTPELHPLVTRVESLEARGDFSTCLVHERVPLGPLSVRNRYRATREVLEQSEERAHLVLGASAALGTTLSHELSLCAVGERCEATHVVRLRAPLLVLGFVARTAQRAHDAWVERVVAWAERDGS